MTSPSQPPQSLSTDDLPRGSARHLARLGRDVITVVAVTSNVARIYPFQVLLPARQTGLPRVSKAQAEQVRSVAVERIGGRLGQLPAALIADLDRALRVHLSM